MPSDKCMTINGRPIGTGHSTYIIAEIGINHNGSEALCAEMITAAAASGADAVKLQTVCAEESYHPASESYEVFRHASLSEDEMIRLSSHARSCRIDFFSTPGEPRSLRSLLKLRMPAIKISSGLLTNLPLIEEAAASGSPLILSTGMAHMTEVAEAVDTARRAGATDIAVLQCTSLYPAPPETLNLAAMNTMRDELSVVVGYSDHCAGRLACIAAVAAGASLIEKHFSTTPDALGADHAISIGAAEFSAMVSEIRCAEAMLGQPKKTPSAAELELRDGRHRRLVAACDMEAGHRISADDLYLMRLPPDRDALPARDIKKVVGRKLTTAVTRLTGITADIVDSEV